MVLRPTPVCRIGTLSTLLANTVLSAGHAAQLSTPFSALVLGGGVFRCLTLPLTVYGDQCLSRTAAALPELREAHHQYTDITNHPKAIVWERRVAAQKLKNDRERIFRNHRTNNAKMMVPHLLALLASWYMLGIPSQQLGEFFTKDAGMDIVSPLAVTLWKDGATGAWSAARAVNLAAGALSGGDGGGVAASAVLAIDPTLTMAATLTLYNVWQFLKRREGFNDRLDEYIRDAKKACLGAYSVVASAGLMATPFASLFSTAVFFPSYLGPIWLGMAGATFAKTILVNNTAPGRALFRIQPYPLEHGSYGGESTAEGHEYRLAFTGVDAEEKRDVWQTQKRALDYECDIRLHKFLSKSGLFDSVEEMEYEAEKLKERRKIAHERALQRQRKRDAEAAKEAAASAREQEDDGVEGSPTATQRRRAAREERRQTYEKQRAEREKARQADLAAAAKAAQDKQEDKWRTTVSLFGSQSASASFSTDGEPVATEFAHRFLDEYNADASQRLVDRRTAREAAYEQRSQMSPEEHLLGSKEAVSAMTAECPQEQAQQPDADRATKR